MEKIKNLMNEELNLQSLGVILLPNQIREIAEFSTRATLQNNASYLNDLVYSNKISIIDADNNEFSKVEAIQFISNAYSKVVVSNTSELKNNGKYYFLKDKFDLKDEIIEKSFNGHVDSIYIIPELNSCEITIITGEGLILQTDEVMKRQTFELETNGKLYNPVIRIYSKYNNSIDIFIDGTSEEETSILQTFIDNWRE